MWRLLFPLCFAATTAIIVDSHYPEETTYNFHYSVNDPYTRDVKNQWEERVGDRVRGSYRLVEAGGTVRTVDYYADGKNGFRAFVRREGHPHNPLTIIPVQPQQSTVPLQGGAEYIKRDYYGATFVREKDYGRGMGYL